ncbi:dephospho-CoA kinase [Abditibacterium utsteinense]|uniref:Dephospho-CoA kinase n=1 Tax=Abditibacterium utsteinense TaxID=1960156 RepID=A0A2S8SXD0_9BACT|nr:dephospho-CoA kinase [Abditibacterium utsteinense]PQV65455.1 dephospho-CoA kinase [Abditibacterium utsteinense]
MKILGLTGDIACGKSTVARILSERGAATLDADLLVRDLYADASFAARVQQLFESDVRDENGGIDRAKLGAVVFNNAAQLQQLETLVHPEVAALRAQKLSEFKTLGQKVVVVEAVKLLESGQGSGCDEIWCVVCDSEVQLQRLTKRRGLSETESRLRLESQPSREAKAELAGEVRLVWIENNTSVAQLAAQVARQWTRFLA